MSNLFSKYHITKNDGSPVDPAAQYFVLRIDTDSAARAAVMVYAMCIEKDDPVFADELRVWVSAQLGAVEHTLAHGQAGTHSVNNLENCKCALCESTRVQPVPPAGKA